jgi:hypothetical protein
VSIWRPKCIWTSPRLTRALGYRLNVEIEYKLTLVKRIHPATECATSCPINAPHARNLYFTHSLAYVWGAYKDWRWVLCLSKKKEYPKTCRQIGCNTATMILSTTKYNILEEQNLPEWQQQITTLGTVVTTQDSLSVATKRRGAKRDAVATNRHREEVFQPTLILDEIWIGVS